MSTCTHTHTHTHTRARARASMYTEKEIILSLKKAIIQFNIYILLK